MSAAPAQEIDASVFKAYDIRGTADTQLAGDVPRRIGAGFARMMREQRQGRASIGRDGRLSSPRIAAALAEGLAAAGIEVADVGLVPTPMLYEHALLHSSGNGIMVTGSHNPKEHNGMKMMLAGRPVVDGQVRGLRDLASLPPEEGASPGAITEEDFAEEYLGRIAADVRLARPLKVVVDCGNGAAGSIAPEALRRIGCEVTGLHVEIDGNFPNHHPDPAKPENLADCARELERAGADLGVAFDGDGDRLGVVSRRDGIVYPDAVLMLYAADALRARPGAKVVYDVKCTRRLKGWVEERGGVPMMSKTGHSFIKRLMREEDALIGGEMSGHFFFRDRWSGYDDAIYAAARLAELVAAGGGLEGLLDGLPRSCASPELQIDLGGIGMSGPEAVARIERELRPGGEDRVVRTDGVRIEYASGGFGLARASNTTSSLVLRFEGDSPENLEEIRGRFREAAQAAGLPSEGL